MQADAPSKPLSLDSVAALLARWGLRPGHVVQGWTALQIERTPARDAALLVFTRDGSRLNVRITRAAGGPCFARVGALELVHGPAEARVARAVEGLLRALVAWLAAHDSGADLVPLLDHASTRPSAPADSGHAYDAGEAPELDPARRTPADRPFIKFETIDVSELGRHSDALRQMYAGTLGGLVIKNVYSPERMARVVQQLAAETTNYPRTSFPARFKAHFYGRCLDGSDPALDEYLRDAERFRAETLAVFGDGTPFEARIEEMLRALAGGRDVRLPRYTDGRAYTPATIRILLEGGQIGTHCGNEAATRPAYSHLNTLIDPADQISYFLTLQAPVQGGELIVYSLKWSDIDESRIVGGRSRVEDLLRDAEWMAVAPGAGDLLLFDGGRYFHRVAMVVGERIRWTIGGFLMFARAGDVIHYWS
jgi:hypothetical protein